MAVVLVAPESIDWSGVGFLGGISIESDALIVPDIRRIMRTHIVFLRLGGSIEMTVVLGAPEAVDRNGAGFLGVVGVETYSFIVPDCIGIMRDDIVFLIQGGGVKMMTVFIAPETVDRDGSRSGW